MNESVTSANDATIPEARWYRATWITVLRVVLAVIAVVIGAAIVLVAAVFGNCSAFGGSCPGGGGFPEDTFRLAASGAALAAAVPFYLVRPTWQRFAKALVVGIAAGAIAGFTVVQSTGG